MKIKFAATPSWNESDSILIIQTEEKEKVSVGDTISIELTDGTYADRIVVAMRRWFCPEGAKRGKWKNVESIQNGESADVTVNNIVSNTIQTMSMPGHEERKAWAEMICITPFKEILGGQDSIYDAVEEGYIVPEKVIAHLKSGKPFLMAPGIYAHPFKESMQLTGPYLYTDGTYYWDRDTWKYAVKYHVKLPQEFVDYVMSDENSGLTASQSSADVTWQDIVKQWKEEQGCASFLAGDAGDIELDAF